MMDNTVSAVSSSGTAKPEEKLTAGMTLAFASPILRFTVPNAVGLNSKLTAEAHAMRALDSGITRSNRQGWHSKTDLMTRKEPGVSELVTFIERVIRSATLTIAPSFNASGYRLVSDGWININPQHGFNVPHRHNGFMWSGTYYVTVPVSPAGSRSGNLEFLSPLTVPGEYGVLGANCYSEKITIRPKAGDLILFPSYLTHWVYPNDTDQERISIAFNGTFLPN